jgi:hypothetical protein
MKLTKIKEFSSLVNNANKLGQRELKLDRDFAISLLAEITVLTSEGIEKMSTSQKTNKLGILNGGSFK